MNARIILKPLQCLTAAPEDYDYSWMRTLAYNVAKDGRGKLFRLAENEDRWHFDQQVMRYGSGICPTITAQKDLEELLASPYGFLTLLDDPIPVHYHRFDFRKSRLDSDRERCRLAHYYLAETMEADPKTLHSRESYIGVGHLAHVRIVGSDKNTEVLARLATLGFQPMTLDEMETAKDEADAANK